MGKDGGGGTAGPDDLSVVKKKYFSNSPILTVDALVEKEGKILLIKRKYPPYGWALPGGKVECGETLEEAIIRELKEETNLIAKRVTRYNIFDKPDRDPRFHAISVTFIIDSYEGVPKAADDAKEFFWVPYAEFIDNAFIKKLSNITEERAIAFDHRKIVLEYISDLISGVI